MDIIIGNSPGQNYIFLNTSNGSVWEKAQLSKEIFRSYDIITSDLNNDGLHDIIEANSDAINRYYFNQKKFDPRKN